MREIQQVQLFEGLSLTQVDHVLSFMRKTIVRRGEFIFLTGESADHLYIIQNGLVKISYITSDGDERVIDFREDGNIFGELFLGHYRHRVGFAQALTDCTLYKLCEQCLFDISQCYPKINHNFIKHLVDSQREAFARMHALSRADAKLRLLGLLVVLARKTYGSTGEEFRLHPMITQTELANMAGLNRSTVSSLINECRREGILSGVRRKIIVHVPQIEDLLDYHGCEVLV
jgi:CRP/FNR family transcriptional regulator, cyclic AMP receptor protein